MEIGGEWPCLDAQFSPLWMYLYTPCLCSDIIAFISVYLNLGLHLEIFLARFPFHYSSEMCFHFFGATSGGKLATWQHGFFLPMNVNESPIAM